MNNEIEKQVKHGLSLMADLPSQVIYSGQAYYNITGDYAHIAKMLRTLFLEHPDSISSSRLLDTFASCLDDLNALRPVKKFRVDHDNMFFEPSLFSLRENEVFVDCGAMDMSTSIEFAYQSGDRFRRIVAFEPDPVCHEACQDNLLFFSKEKRDAIKLFGCGLSDHEGSVPFERSFVLGNSRIVEKSEESILVKKMDDIEECQDATFIKIHVEGAALSVLRGAEKIICDNRPLLAISCYHNLTELLEIPAYLSALSLGYRFYMRHYSTGTSESVLYAMQDSRIKQQ